MEINKCTIVFRVSREETNKARKFICKTCPIKRGCEQEDCPIDHDIVLNIMALQANTSEVRIFPVEFDFHMRELKEYNERAFIVFKDGETSDGVIKGFFA